MELTGGQPGRRADGEVRGAWAGYVRVIQATNGRAERLSAVPGPVLRASAVRKYRPFFFRYLMDWAPPSVRAVFLDELMDETYVSTEYTRSSIAAVGSVDTATVRVRIPGFARNTLRAESVERYSTPLHLVWLYGDFAAVQAILRAWRKDRDEDPDEFFDDYIDGFEGRHPMPVVADSELDAWMSAALAAVPGEPGDARQSAPEPDAVAQADLLWGELRAAFDAMMAAGRSIAKVGDVALLRYALTVPGHQVHVARLLGTRFCKTEKMAAAADLIGADFYAVHFPLMLELAASSVTMAISLLPVLRRTAQAAGRDDWA